MRDDFAKQLTERERVRHYDHYHNYRHVKGPAGAWGDDEVGGRERMRVRYNYGYDRKSFNENLNPLKGWIRSCIGKKWDKCYSELRGKFDARSVVNAHILEHLFDYICVHTKVVDGKAIGLSRWVSDGYVPVKQLSHDYYVCPKDGTVKVISKQSRRRQQKEREAKKNAERAAIFRQLDEGNVLHFIDGVWYHFEMKPIPEVQFSWTKPHGVTSFECGSYGKKVMKTWDELNQQERERFGQKIFGAGIVRDLFTNETMYRDKHGNTYKGGSRMIKHRHQDRPAPRYHATKATASHKLLKQAGIVK